MKCSVYATWTLPKLQIPRLSAIMDAIGKLFTCVSFLYAIESGENNFYCLSFLYVSFNGSSGSPFSRFFWNLWWTKIWDLTPKLFLVFWRWWTVWIMIMRAAGFKKSDLLVCIYIYIFFLCVCQNSDESTDKFDT